MRVGEVSDDHVISSVIGATTILPPSSSLRAAVSGHILHCDDEHRVRGNSGG